METFYETPLSLVLDIGNMLLSLSVFLFLIYLVQAQSFLSRTSKYKFVSQKESKAMRGAALILAASVAFYAVVLMGLSVNINAPVGYVFTGLFATGVGVALGYVLWSYLSYYHPFILEKRLNDIRFSPMKSPITGKPMTLLNEAQEDAHLSQEMIEEENNLSVDYDVWIDEASDYKVIERYDTRFHPLVCSSCNFRTLMERKQEIRVQPQQHVGGLLRKHYECTYCDHMESKDVNLPSWDEEGRFEEYDKDLTENKRVRNSGG